MKKTSKLLSIFLLIFVACSTEAESEFDKCQNSYKTIQESYVDIGNIYPDAADIYIYFGDVRAGLQNVWFYYAIQNYSGEGMIDNFESVITDGEGFNEELWNELESVTSEEEFFAFIERPIIDLEEIKSNLESAEPDINNITNHGEVIRSVNLMIQATKNLKKDFPEIPDNFDEFEAAITTNYDIAIDYTDKIYDEYAAINLVILAYEKCVEEEN